MNGFYVEEKLYNIYANSISHVLMALQQEIQQFFLHLIFENKKNILSFFHFYDEKNKIDFNCQAQLFYCVQASNFPFNFKNKI